MDYYMVELRLTEQPVLVVGGGKVARRKVEGLLPCGARISVIAPQLEPVLAELAAAGRIRHVQQDFTPEYLEKEKALLVFASAPAVVNLVVAGLCREKGILCNSADDPEVSGFLVPAVVRRQRVSVAVGTGGLSPALSRLLKERIEAWLEPGWGALAALFGRMRQKVREEIPGDEARYAFLREMALRAAREGRMVEEEGNEAWFLEQLGRMSKK